MANLITAAAFTQGLIDRAHNPSPIDVAFCARNIGIAPLEGNYGGRGVTAITTLITYGHTLHLRIRYNLVQIQAHVALDLKQINVGDVDVMNQENSHRRT